MLRIYSTNFMIIDSVYFGPQAVGVSQGRLLDGGASIVSFASSPSPGESNYLPLDNAIINEVLTHTAPPLEDAVELHNPSGAPASIGGWYLSDNRSDYKKYRIPDGTTIPAGGYLVIYQNQFSNSSPTSFTFDSAHGGAAILSAADAASNLTGYRSSTQFGAAANGVSFGRFVTSVGIDFVAMSQHTFGADNPGSLSEFRTGAGQTNAYPEVGPVVISEIMYHPPPWTNAVGDADGEYIELQNITGSSVGLYDPAYPSNRWRLANAVEFTFPENVMLPAGGRLLVVDFNPLINIPALTQFRDYYGLSPSVPIYGPYLGKLDNGGEQVELYKPDPPQPPPAAGFVPYVLVDHVQYSDSPPWPAGADGGGLSLQRRDLNLYGNDPLNWLASAPTPGAPNGTGVVVPPSITVSPQDQMLPEDATVSLSVTAAGGGPLNYQWRRNRISIPDATNAILVISYVQLEDSGAYDVFVSNPSGCAFSAPANVFVTVPPMILASPRSQTIRSTSNAVFTVLARGSLPLAYHWSFKQTDIPGATGSTLLLTNVQLSQTGDYTVTISNAFGSVSASATLLVLENPVITLQPQSKTVAVGENVTLSVSASGTLPMTYRWRRNNSTLTNIILNNNICFFTTNNVQTNSFFNVAITNIAGLASGGQVLGLSSNAYITVMLPPSNQIASTGSTVTFSTAPRGPTDIRYQWQFNGGNLPDATNATLTLSNVQQADNGTYGVTVRVITNAVVPPATFTATLTVVEPPLLTEPQLLLNGDFRVLLQHGIMNANYIIDESTNLINWATLMTLSYTSNPTPFTDTTTGARKQRFYRVRYSGP